MYLQSVQPALAAQGALGQQNTLVMLLNFKENPNEQPMSAAEANSLVFDTVDDFYRENSFGQTWFSGQVVGWYTLPVSNQVCDLSAVRDAADQKAIASGIQLDQYDRIVYMMTKTACGIAGSATMQGTPSRAWINGNFSAMNIAHELGHNLGLRHSGSLDCGEQPISDQCTRREYGDTYDVMGGSNGYINTFQKEQLGWLEGAHAAKTIEVTQSGTYAITNYETQGNEPVTIKVPRGIDPTTGKKSWFYIEYRQSVGYDDFLDARSYVFYRGDVTDGIVIRSALEGDERSSNLLHFKMGSEYYAITGSNDWYDPAMPVGGTYTDPLSGATISLKSANGTQAEVTVTLNGSDSGDDKVSCAINAPSINAQAITGSTVFAGKEVQYQVTITNNDSADCASNSFDISTVVPFGWQATNDQVTLAPGASGQVVIAVTSSQDATAKDYSLSIKATHGADSAYSAATAVRYTVVADETTTPAVVAVDDMVALSAKVSVVIDVLANDIVDAQAPATVTSITQPSKGNVELLSDGTLRYTPGRRFKNNDSFSYTITDGNTRSTAYVSVRLQSDGGNSGGPGKGKNK
ncbi:MULTISPECIES: Ig-like domain-containing protein [unclassified Pseudoalteromonas]|uniref:Ig-like domain-containing protein n=1 Tax=unclassified Pseudoalteromonas TaxID=194690 RepID=UPI0018F86B6A|nr:MULTISPECIES: Ig-like domain-containing protein [unclassified Pseudoalteromonas]